MFSFTKNGKLQNYKEMKPAFSMKDYFNGPVKGWGIIQDWRGNVISRFDMELVGTWDGDKGKLEETFRYYDGSTQQRTWLITKKPDGTFQGQASDVVGEAKGNTSGNAANWQYSMNIPVEDKTYLLKLDDWMWQLNDGVLVNRTYLKKFGFTVAELTVFMQKQEQ